MDQKFHSEFDHTFMPASKEICKHPHKRGKNMRKGIETPTSAFGIVKAFKTAKAQLS